MKVIKLDVNFYSRVEPIQWFSRCGESSHPDLGGLPVQWVEDRTAALQSMFSMDWADANTHATAELTGYLAQTDYDTYGATWNELARRSRSLIEEMSIQKRVLDAIEMGGWPVSLSDTPLPEITPPVCASIGRPMADRFAAKAWAQCISAWILGHVSLAALELTYRQTFPGVPIFFERLMRIYEAGRLPCGWDGSLDRWPEGRLMVH
jgi:hypothetical protein